MLHVRHGMHHYTQMITKGCYRPRLLQLFDYPHDFNFYSSIVQAVRFKREFIIKQLYLLITLRSYVSHNLLWHLCILLFFTIMDQLKIHWEICINVVVSNNLHQKVCKIRFGLPKHSMNLLPVCPTQKLLQSLGLQQLCRHHFSLHYNSWF